MFKIGHFIDKKDCSAQFVFPEEIEIKIGTDDFICD
jgi:hypothetical protein